jgi:hypothetical protein
MQSVSTQARGMATKAQRNKANIQLNINLRALVP